MQNLGEWQFGISGLDGAVDLRGDLTDFAPGSRNLLPDGLKQSRPFRGMEFIGNGVRRMFQIKDTWGGLDDIGANQASGSLFSSVGDMLVYIGQGQVRVESLAIAGAVASGVLRFLLKWNGSYSHVNSGPYDAGLPEPSAPAVGIVDSALYGTPNLSGTVSVKYARLRSTTGGRSRASATSAVLVVNNRAIYAVVPEAVAGQTHHIFFGTDTKLGGIGLHFRIARANPFTSKEYTEDDVERTISPLTTLSTDILVDASGRFTAGDIGKRVAAVSGFTVPAGTVVAEVLSSNQIRLSNAFTITSGVISATLIAYAGGIDRSVVLNWQPSDLVEDTAWIYDFPPPTGSHAFQLENRMFVCSFADASADASASNPGTALMPSIPNHFESYDPRFPVFLPEAVVDILSDGMESYKFIGGKNGIYAAQYLNVSDAAPLTLTVLLRGEGIQTPNNWCARERAIYLYTGKGQPVRIIEGGQVDKSFAAKVRHLMRDWTQAETVVSAHPSGGGVVYSNGNRAYFFDEATNRWSTAIGLNDFFAGEGTIISSVSTRSELIVTLNIGSLRRAYYFDKGSGAFVVGIGHYRDSPAPQKQKIIQALKAVGVMDRTDTTGYIGIHANTLPAYVSDGAISSGNNLFTSPTANFTQELVGSYILIKSAASGGAWLLGRILSVPNATSLRVGTTTANLADSVALNSAATLTGAYALIGLRIFPFTVNRKGTFEIDSGEMFLNGISSYAVSMMMQTVGVNAQPLSISLEGSVNMEEGWNLPSANFGQTI